MMSMRSRAAALLVVFAGCTDAAPRELVGPGEGKPLLSNVAYVNVCCPATVYQGTSYQVYADIVDTYGEPVFGRAVAWSTSGNGVASIYGSLDAATVQAIRPGTTTIYAYVDGRMGSTSLTVLAVPVVTTVQITPSQARVQVGASQQLTARAYDQYGNLMSGKTATWSTGNTAVATISATGKVTGKAVGTTTASATIDGVSAAIPVTVEPYFAVFISGPSAISTAGEYTWIASATGGSGGYGYRWWIEWNTAAGQLQEHGAGSAATLWVDRYTPSYFILHVEATSGSQTVTQQMGVCNFTGSIGC